MLGDDLKHEIPDEYKARAPPDIQVSSPSPPMPAKKIKPVRLPKDGEKLKDVSDLDQDQLLSRLNDKYTSNSSTLETTKLKSKQNLKQKKRPVSSLEINPKKEGEKSLKVSSSRSMSRGSVKRVKKASIQLLKSDKKGDIHVQIHDTEKQSDSVSNKSAGPYTPTTKKAPKILYKA